MPVVPHIVKAGTGQNHVAKGRPGHPFFGNWQLRFCIHFSGEDFLLEDFGFILFQAQSLPTTPMSAHSEVDFLRDWMTPLGCCSQLRPVLQNMPVSVSSAHSATNSPRFFVGGSRHGRRIVECFTSFFWGKFRFWEEKVSPHG